MKKILIVAFLMLNFCVNAHSSNSSLSANESVNHASDSLYAGMSHSQFTRYIQTYAFGISYYEALVDVLNERENQILAHIPPHPITSDILAQLEPVVHLKAQLVDMRSQYRSYISCIEDQKRQGILSANDFMNLFTERSSNLLSELDQKKSSVLYWCQNASEETFAEFSGEHLTETINELIQE